jgi:hypothetical protein
LDERLPPIGATQTDDLCELLLLSAVTARDEAEQASVNLIVVGRINTTEVGWNVSQPATSRAIS